MKTQLTIRIFLFLFSFVMFTNCTKKDDITPANIADKIAGSYTMTYVAANGSEFNLPYSDGTNQLTGTISINKISQSTISFTYNLNIIANGVRDTKTNTGNFEIKQNGSAIDLYDTAKVGSFANNILSIDSGGTKISAKKN